MQTRVQKIRRAQSGSPHIINGSVAAIVLELLLAMSRFAGASFTYLGRVPGIVYDVNSVLVSPVAGALD